MKWIKRKIEEYVSLRVDEEVRARNLVSVYEVRDGDIIVLPESIDEKDFEALISLLPKGKMVGVITSDSVKVIQL